MLLRLYCSNQTLNQFNNWPQNHSFSLYIFPKSQIIVRQSALKITNMKSRIIIGTIATLLSFKQFFTINKLQFPYPYISEPNNKVYQNQNSQKVSFKKNTWILSFKVPQPLAQKFEDLKDSDLILCENPKGDYVFKIVGAVSRNYTPFQNGVSNFIPPGFVFLLDPVRKQVGMENIAVVTSTKHYSLGKFDSWWKQLNFGTKEQQKQEQPQGQSLERQILERNNVRELIKQAQIFKKDDKDSQQLN